MSGGRGLIISNITLLQQGIKQLQNIDDHSYTLSNQLEYKSSVGCHFRHVVEHYRALPDAGTDPLKLDYGQRERDPHLENDRMFAIDSLEALIEQLRQLKSEEHYLCRDIFIKNNESVSSGVDAWSRSSVERELQFLISHTVHHYALAAIILRIQGWEPGKKFGVAPSTLRYRSQQLNVS